MNCLDFFFAPLRRWPLAVVLVGLALGLGWVVLAGAAGPVFWDYPAASSFAELDLDGIGLDRFGRLTPGLAAEVIFAGAPEVFWCAVPDDSGGLFAASGHSGQIWHLDHSGTGRLLAALPEPEVLSLLRLGSQLFAGCGPDGLLFRVSPDGETEIWADLAEGYIWALVAGDKGEIFVAAGAPAALYRVTRRLEVERLATFPAANVLDLARTDTGDLLIGTQGPGLVYRLDPDRPAERRVLFEAGQEEIRQFLTGPDGAWHLLAMSRRSETAAGAAAQPGAMNVGGNHGQGNGGNGRGDLPERAALFRLGPDDLVNQVWAGDVTLLTAAYCPRWGWLAAGAQEEQDAQATLHSLKPPRGIRPLATWDGGDVFALMLQAEGEGREEVVLCQANPGRLVRLTDRPSAFAVAVSEPLDGGVPIRWGRLRWEGVAPRGAELKWSVRGGARSVPDDTWTEWSEPWTETDHEIPLPPSRFLQWRLEIGGQRAGAAVAAVTISGWEPNLPPAIFQFELQPEGEMHLGGLLSREENVTETFGRGLRAEYTVTSRLDRRAGLSRAAPARPLRTFTWLATDPNEDRLVFRLEYQRLGELTWRPLRAETSEFLGSWDTSSVPDGTYVVRLVASDKPDNPAGEVLTSERVSAPLTVDHTPPEITRFKVRRTDRGLAISFRATDAASPLAEAWVELPGGGSERLDPEDLICDSLAETFAVELDFPRPDRPAPPEPWRVRVEVADRLGNVAAEEGEAR